MSETQSDNLHRVVNAPRDHVLRACATAYVDREETRELAVRLHTHVLAHRWTESQLAEKIGLPHDLVHRVWYGYAKADEVKSFGPTVEKYFASIGNPRSPAYAENQFIEAMRRVAETVQRRSRRGEPNVVAYVNGTSGLGKSLFFEAWCAENDQFYHSIKPMGGPQALMRDLSRRFGVGVYASQYIVLQRLYDSVGAGDVLVFNQCDRLVRRKTDIQEGVDLIWDLAEATKCGVVLLDTDGKFEKHLMDTGYHARQLWRRCVRIEQLPRSGSVEDIKGLFRFRCPHLEIDNHWLANAVTLNEHEKGGFGIVATIINDAEDWSKFKGRRLPSQADIDLAIIKKMTSIGIKVRA